MKVNLKSLPMFDEKAFNKSAFEARKEKERMLQENADLKNKIDNVPYQLPQFDQDRNAKIMKESFLNKTKDIIFKRERERLFAQVLSEAYINSLVLDDDFKAQHENNLRYDFISTLKEGTNNDVSALMEQCKYENDFNKNLVKKCETRAMNISNACIKILDSYPLSEAQQIDITKLLNKMEVFGINMMLSEACKNKEATLSDYLDNEDNDIVFGNEKCNKEACNKNNEACGSKKNNESCNKESCDEDDDDDEKCEGKCKKKKCDDDEKCDEACNKEACNKNSEACGSKNNSEACNKEACNKNSEACNKEACNKNSEACGKFRKNSESACSNCEESGDEIGIEGLYDEEDMEELSSMVKDKVISVIQQEEEYAKEQESFMEDFKNVAKLDENAGIQSYTVAGKEEYTLFRSMMIKNYKNILNNAKNDTALSESYSVTGTGSIKVNNDFVLANSIIDYTKLELLNTAKLCKFDRESLKAESRRNVYSN